MPSGICHKEASCPPVCNKTKIALIAAQRTTLQPCKYAYQIKNVQFGLRNISIELSKYIIQENYSKALPLIAYTNTVLCLRNIITNRSLAYPVNIENICENYSSIPFRVYISDVHSCNSLINNFASTLDLKVEILSDDRRWKEMLCKTDFQWHFYSIVQKLVLIFKTNIFCKKKFFESVKEIALYIHPSI